MTDPSHFPDPTYRDTVLAPLFEGVKVHFARGMDQINRAHLVMLHDTAILNPDQAGKIAAALRDISHDLEGAELSYTGEHEDYFFLVEHELRERLGDLGGALHTARSRNDMDHTLFRMALLARAQTFNGELLNLIDKLTCKAKAERDTLIVAYTHGQPAQPSTFGHYIASVIEVLLRDAARLQQAIKNLDLCPMGAAAITTSGFPIDRQQMAQLLGFGAPTRNSYGSIASVDYITGLYSAMKLIFVHLGRVTQDMAFWSSFEVGQLYVPNALVQVSSIMPQKRNPVPIEHMRHLASVSAFRCDIMVNTMHNTPHTDMNDSEGEVQQAGFASFESGTRMINLLAAFLPACSIDADRVTSNTNKACITITELADSLVREEDLSFRQAHKIAAHTAKAAIKQQIPLHQGYDAFREAFEAQIERPPGLDKTAFQAAVDARSFVDRRDRFGGPAPAAMNDALASYRRKHQALAGDAADLAKGKRLASEKLHSAFQNL